jgi:CheY-like chemotaxis protein
MNQRIQLHVLKRLDIENVDVVDNGQEAVDKEAEKVYDVVLMDMQMPVMDGIDACQRIVGRKDGHWIPQVIFVTAQVSNGFESECFKAGASGLIPKPIKGIKKCLQELARSSLTRTAPSSFTRAIS